jgi:hypothetical protein
LDEHIGLKQSEFAAALGIAPEQRRSKFLLEIKILEQQKRGSAPNYSLIGIKKATAEAVA